MRMMYTFSCVLFDIFVARILLAKHSNNVDVKDEYQLNEEKNCRIEFSFICTYSMYINRLGAKQAQIWSWNLCKKN